MTVCWIWSNDIDESHTLPFVFNIRIVYISTKLCFIVYAASMHYSKHTTRGRQLLFASLESNLNPWKKGKKNKNNPHLQFHCIRVMWDTFSLINRVMYDGKTADHFFLLEARLNAFAYEKSPISPKWWTTGHCLVGFFHSFALQTKSHSHTLIVEPSRKKCEEFCVFHGNRAERKHFSHPLAHSLITLV